MNKTNELHAYQTNARTLLKAFSALNPDRREVVTHMMISHMSPTSGRPLAFLKKEPAAKVMRREFSRWLCETVSPDFGKAWKDWITTFDRIKGINEHSARLVISYLVTNLLELEKEFHEKHKTPTKA